MDSVEADIATLLRERPGASEDEVARVRSGEPLAYVIGNIPFLGVAIDLSSRPLIPRPETEWWAEELCKRIADAPLRVLDLCAGSGAIGLAVLKHCPNTFVSFGEVVPEHAELVKENLIRNRLDPSRADIRTSDLFAAFSDERYDLVVTNPPYIPASRTLPESVAQYEPREALFSGSDGLDLIRRILSEVPLHLKERGEVWMECDTSNLDAANELALTNGASWTRLRTDQYGRPRLLVAYY